MLNLIPKPYSYKENYGEFVLDATATVYADAELTKARDVFVGLVEKVCGYKINVVVSKKAKIVFYFDRTQGDEEYRIESTTQLLQVYASGFAGAYYAVQTLRQLFCMDMLDAPQILTMHTVSIEDKPTYKWRAMMLDESRHFIGMDGVKRFIDLMATYKLNVLHWHLTDNVGWRIEIKKYPKLAEIGSYRKGTQIAAWGRPNEINWVPHEGCYMQDEVKEIVAYAAAHNVMVVPEIDMPAHFVAAIAAYPELSCKGKHIEVSVRHGDNASVIACAGKQSTYDFIYSVIDELCELFPAPYFHIGGDEAQKKEWKTCPLCQQTIREHGLDGEEGLQAYFNNKISVYLKHKGRRMIGWNEVLKSEIEGGVIAQYWTPGRDKNVEEQVLLGRDVIVSKHQNFYFDMPYAMRNLRTTYGFDAESIGLTDKNVMGVEGTLWSEWIQNEERLDFQSHPRMEALSEVAWTSKQNRNYEEFTERLKRRLPALDKLGVNYASLNIVDRHGLRAKRICAIFGVKNANYEFERAMRKKRK